MTNTPTSPVPALVRGTEGRIYGGDDTKVHIQDGQRGALGVRIADFIDADMRAGDPDATPDMALCPGCYMIALVGAAMTLAHRNGQSLRELGMAMSHHFFRVAERAAAGETQALPEEMLITPFADLGRPIIEGDFTVVAERQPPFKGLTLADREGLALVAAL